MSLTQIIGLPRRFPPCQNIVFLLCFLPIVPSKMFTIPSEIEEPLLHPQRVKVSDGVRAAMAQRRERLRQRESVQEMTEKKPGPLDKLRRSLSARLLRGEGPERKKRFTSLIARDNKKSTVSVR